MFTQIVISKNKNSAISMEQYKSGTFGLILESKKVFDENKVESVHAIFTREELIEIRDAANKLLESSEA